MNRYILDKRIGCMAIIDTENKKYLELTESGDLPNEFFSYTEWVVKFRIRN